MKLIAQIDGENLPVEIVRSEVGLRATVDGCEYAITESAPEPNVFLIEHEGRIYEAFVDDRGPAVNSGKVASIAGRDFEINLIDPKKMRSVADAGDGANGIAELRTAMPGKVVRLLRAVGDAVEKGEGVLVVEAMKMQNELKSPKSGLVTELRALEGATVGAGDVLAVIE